MKRLSVLLFSLLVFLFSVCREKQIYQSGRDTLKSFGNGRFQILRSPREGQVFYDLMEQRRIFDSHIKWKKQDGDVLVIGFTRTEPFCVRLNLKTNTLTKEPTEL